MSIKIQPYIMQTKRYFLNMHRRHILNLPLIYLKPIENLNINCFQVSILMFISSFVTYRILSMSVIYIYIYNLYTYIYVYVCVSDYNRNCTKHHFLCQMKSQVLAMDWGKYGPCGMVEPGNTIHSLRRLVKALVGLFALPAIGYGTVEVVYAFPYRYVFDLSEWGFICTFI